VKLDTQVDALYQLPLEQFTEKRNALAKELSGASKKQVKFLPKPPLPIWAVNQLYWNDRPTYNALIDASEKLRSAHRSALTGHKVDIPKAEQLHRAALEKAVAKTIALLTASQEQVSDAARDTVRKALGALPNDEAPGRLTRAPEAAGFSLLTGIKVPPQREVGRDSGRAPAKPAAGRDVGGAPAKPAAGRDFGRAQAKAEAEAKARAERAKREREKAVTAAERELQHARKAAEQAKFKVRKLSADLQRAQTSEEQLAGQVSAAEEKLKALRIAD
jgi:hypothetical protein